MRCFGGLALFLAAWVCGAETELDVLADDACLEEDSEYAMSLRQLRGELRVAEIEQHSVEKEVDRADEMKESAVGQQAEEYDDVAPDSADGTGEESIDAHADITKPMMMERVNESMVEINAQGGPPTAAPGFCKGKPEGQNCIPGHPSTAYEYCSAGRPLPMGKNCWRKRGKYSRCHEGGIGLTHGECDDPFCRQQRGGRTHFCQGSSVVSCSGTGPNTAATPRTVESCSDRTSDEYGCKVTHHYSCSEDGGAHCYWSGDTRDCSDQYSSSRRRR